METKVWKALGEEWTGWATGSGYLLLEEVSSESQAHKERPSVEMLDMSSSLVLSWQALDRGGVGSLGAGAQGQESDLPRQWHSRPLVLVTWQELRSPKHTAQERGIDLASTAGWSSPFPTLEPEHPLGVSETCKEFLAPLTPWSCDLLGLV